MAVPNTTVALASPNSTKSIIFKNCAPFTDLKSQMGNKEADHAKEIVVAMPIYSLIKDRDHYSKTSGSL